MWIQISSGRGPAECERAVYLFYYNLMEKLLKNSALNYRVIDFTEGERKESYQSILLHVEEIPETAGLFEKYQGSFQWVCKSEYRPNHGRKNWFFQCEVFQEPENKIFHQKDIEFSSMKSGGAGGQHVNKTESAIRARHVPSGITVTASEERSQNQNKKLALSRILRILEKQEKVNKEKARQETWKSHNKLVRGLPKKVFMGIEFKEKL